MNRRHFLKLSVPVATLPFLPATLGGLGTTKKAHAQGNFPRRLFLVFSGCGTVESQFYPQGGETDFTFAPGSINEPIAKFKSKLIFPKGVRRMTSGSGAHEKNMGGVWTGSGLVATNGYPTSASVDQIIANKLPAGPMFKSLQFGAQCDSFNRGGNKPVLKSMTYSGRNAVLSPEDDPNVMFAKLMIAPAPSGGGVMGPSPEELTRLRDKKKSVLDAVRGDLQTLMGRIDRDDRSRLEAHLTSLSAIEKRLSEPLGGQPSTVGCTAPQKPAANLGDAAARLDNANFPAILDIQNKLAVAALACNRTQVVSVQWSRAFSGVRHTWVGVQEDHHTLSHKTGAGDIKNQHAINRWYSERLAELLGNLDSVKEGSGTLLDNTLLVWGNEAMNGLHDAGRMPGLMAGSCGGKLKTGRLLELPGNDWSQVLVSMCHAMGVTDVDKVGELPMKTGPIQALFA